MFVLLIGCVFQLNLVEGTETSTLEQKPQQLLQKSLHHVKALLADIDDKIGQERQLLSQLGGNAALPADMYEVTQTLPIVTDPRIASIVADWAKNNPILMYPDPTLDGKVSVDQPTRSSAFMRNLGRVQRQGSDATAATFPTTPIIPTPQELIGELPVDVEPEELPGLPAGWPFNDDSTTTVTPLIISVTEKPTIKQEMVNLMKRINVGYCYAAMSGLNDIMVDKEDADLTVLINALSKTMLRMIEQGKFTAVGPVLTKRLKVIWIWTSLLSVAAVKSSVKQTQLKFKVKDAFPDDLHEVFSEYDELFTPEEGEKLFDILLKIDNYNKTVHGAGTAEVLCESLINGLLVPLNRNHGSFKLASIIAKANRAYANRYPDYRRSEVFEMLDSIFGMENRQTSETRRRISKNSKHFKSNYKGLIRHLILKHPTLLKYFSKHYYHNANRKHRHSKWKKHHKSHHKKHHLTTKRRHQYHYRNKWAQFNTETTTQRITQEIIQDMLPEMTLESPNFREYYMKTTYMYTENQKRYSIVSAYTGLGKRISPSVLTRRSLANNKSHFREAGNFYKSIPNRLNFSQKDSITKNQQNNKILDKIVAESSYSDEEKYLKTMLYDAFFHGNDTLKSDKTKTHYMRAEHSDTDEEWIFKSNIYKVFQEMPN